MTSLISKTRQTELAELAEEIFSYAFGKWDSKEAKYKLNNIANWQQDLVPVLAELNEEEKDFVIARIFQIADKRRKELDKKSPRM